MNNIELMSYANIILAQYNLKDKFHFDVQNTFIRVYNDSRTYEVLYNNIYVQDNKEDIIAYELYKIIRTFSNDFDIINTSLHLSKKFAKLQSEYDDLIYKFKCVSNTLEGREYIYNKMKKSYQQMQKTCANLKIKNSNLHEKIDHLISLLGRGK